VDLVLNSSNNPKMKMEFDIMYVEALWVLGLININDLPRVANKALAHGLESKSLLELAIFTSEAGHDARRLFQNALEELGRGKISKANALKYYAKCISDRILSSSLSPLDGAKMIWHATLENQILEFHDLDPFIYAAS
jgi:hypothetical protein